MEKIEFYQSKIRSHRKLSKIFLSTFFQILAMNVINQYFDLVVCFEKIFIFSFMEKIEFYQRSGVIENYRKYFYRHFFKFLAMNVIKYFDLVVCFEKIINF